MVNAVEIPLKRLLFQCKACGSCLLGQTHLICPMNCPKGLRNGPCGGTLDGMCEVLPDRPCVWTRIREKDDLSVLPLSVRAPADPALFGSSSYLNLIDGSDRRTRLPASIPSWTEPSAPQTGSGLEKKLLEGGKVLTVELQSPRTQNGLGRIAGRVKMLLPWVDAFNTTSHAGGHRTLSSLDTAKAVTHAGGEAVVQVCGRDVTPAQFLDELVAASEAGICNLLCLTGDWPRTALPGIEARERFFPMDSSQMILEARHLCENGSALFASLGNRRPPGFFIGAAANPGSDPVESNAARTVQKTACGARFIQTQVVFDPDRFVLWRQQLDRHCTGSRPKILASIPIVGSVRALDVIRGIPGIVFPAAVEERLRRASDLHGTALDFADHLMEGLLGRNAVDGFHLVPFGAEDDMLVRATGNARGRLERNYSGNTVCHL